ncbi:hypothetical protein FOC1_g10000285, partial [Fusarium oxysporum f. sp. cubense race 1]
IDINLQVVAELSRSGGRGRSEQPGGRRCGVYSKGGYNARTYKHVLKSSEEEFNK